MATDRNQQARDDFAAARARKQFQDAVAGGMAGIRDRFGRMIQIGDQIAYSSSLPLIAEVVEAGPDLRPNAQPGVMKLTLAIPVELFMVANQQQSALIVLARREGAGVPEAPAEPPAEPPAAVEEISTEHEPAAEATEDDRAG